MCDDNNDSQCVPPDYGDNTNNSSTDDNDRTTATDGDDSRPDAGGDDDTRAGGEGDGTSATHKADNTTNEDENNNRDDDEKEGRDPGTSTDENAGCSRQDSSLDDQAYSGYDRSDSQGRVCRHHDDEASANASQGSGGFLHNLLDGAGAHFEKKLEKGFYRVEDKLLDKAGRELTRRWEALSEKAREPGHKSEHKTISHQQHVR